MSAASSHPFHAAASLAVVEDGNSGIGNASYTGVVYSGLCWRVHSMRAIPLPGVGLANTLFGLLATLTFVAMLHVIHANHRRARRDETSPGPSARASRAGSTYSETSGSDGGSFLARFAVLGGLGAPQERNSGLAFSSYFKFLNVSAAWALMWAVWNLFPQTSTGRDLPTLVWHAIVASFAYTASITLELAVVVFLLAGGVGRSAFRTAAAVTGFVTLLYGSLQLYFRLALDIPPARASHDYPIAQVDFIASDETIMFLGVASAMFTAFFLATGLFVAFWASPAATGTRRRRRKRVGGGRASYIAKTETAATPLMGSPAPTPAGALAAPSPQLKTATPHNPNAGANYQSEGEYLRRPDFEPAANESSSHIEIRVSVAEPSPSFSSSSVLLRMATADEATTDNEVHSRSPSPGVDGGTVTRPLHFGPAVPKRRSVVWYSLFLSLYYCMKTTGLFLLYVEVEAGICLLDLGILLYMMVYAYLLHWTLVADSKYWHDLLAAVQVGREADEDEDAAQQQAAEERRLLTESGSGTPRRHGPLGLPPRSKRGRTPRGASDEDHLGPLPSGGEGRLDMTAFASSNVFSPSSRRSHARTGSVLLRDWLIPSNALVHIRLLVVPEAAVQRALSSLSSSGIRRRHGGRDSPALSRSGSGSGSNSLSLGLVSGRGPSTSSPGAGGGKWSLSHVSSRVGAGLRVVTGVGIGASSSPSGNERSCELWLVRKGGQSAALKQFSLGSLTPDFFRRGLSDWLQLVPMGDWLGKTPHANVASVLGVCVDPPCLSLVFEYGARGTLYDMLHPLAAPAATSPTGPIASPPPPSAPVSSPVASAAGHDGPTSPGYQSLVDPSPSAPPTTGRPASHSFSHASGPALLPLLSPFKLSGQLARGMAHLHRALGYDGHALHLSPANITLTESLDLLVCNLAAPASAPITGGGFGGGGGGGRSKRSGPSAPAWAAPEVLAGGPITRAANVYSFATILWGLLTWQYPCVLVAREIVPAHAAQAERSKEHSRSSSASASASVSAASSYNSPLPRQLRQPVSSTSPPVRRVGAVGAPSAATAATILKPRNSLVPGATNPIPTRTPPVDAIYPASSSIVLGLTPPASVRSPGEPSPSPPPAEGETVAAAASPSPSPVRSRSPSSGVLVACPATPSDDGLGSDASDEDDAEEDEEGPAPIPPHYVRVPLSDLKVCQRLVLIENVRPPIPLGCPPAVSRLLEQCWSEDPSERPSFDLIAEHLDATCRDLEHLALPLELPGPSPLGPDGGATHPPEYYV